MFHRRDAYTARGHSPGDDCWQRAVIYGGAHAIAFNADIDSARGALSPATTLTFPDGSTYTGEGAAGFVVEYVYQSQNEKQRMSLKFENGLWRILSAEVSQRVQPLIPYGKPVTEAQ